MNKTKQSEGESIDSDEVALDELSKEQLLGICNRMGVRISNSQPEEQSHECLLSFLKGVEWHHQSGISLQGKNTR